MKKIKTQTKPPPREYSPEEVQALERNLRAQSESWAQFQLEAREKAEIEEKFWLYKQPPGIKRAVEVAKRKIVAVLFPKRLYLKKRL